MTSTGYDAAGRVTSQQLPGGRTIAFTYDAAGNLTSLTPPGQPAHQFTYNAGNLVSSLQAPAVPGSTGTTTFSYSREKELLGLTRADSATVSIGYDAAGRASSVTSPDGVHAVTYDAATGHVTMLGAPGGVAQSFTYDGALPTSTTWSGPRVNGTVGVSYDQALRPADLTVGGQSLGGIFYGADGLPVSIGPVSLSYRADNALLETVSGGSATTTFAYDSLGQVLFSATVGDVNADTLLRQAFTYDQLGRVVALAERVQADTVTYAYAYDAAGRLAEVRTGGVVTQAYTYDLNGNRTRVVTASQTLTAAYDAQDRLLNNGSATYVHAATGERTLKVVGTDTTRYRYDTFGNLRDVWLPSAQGGTHVQYEVDPQQRRTARLVNGVVTQRWLYQSQLAIAAEVDSAGNPVRTYVYGAHGNVPELMTTPSGQTFRVVTDQLGSVRLVIDAAADTVVQRLDYDVYGRVVRDTKPGFQPFGYAGGLYEPLTGLVRFGARDYDAETGRWTAQDPMSFGAGTADVYAYVGGNPVSWGDPSGRCIGLLAIVCAQAARGAIDGAAAGALFAMFQDLVHGCPIDWSNVLTEAGRGAVLGMLANLGLGLFDYAAVLRAVETEGLVGETVLGSGPSYQIVGEARGAAYLDVPANTYSRLRGMQWPVNRAFLDGAVARGDDFVLSTHPGSAGPNFQRELVYLREQYGLVPSTSGTRLVRVP